jgi:hypothetical protein
MDYTTDVEIYRLHLEKSLERTAGVPIFGNLENRRDWLRYCSRTNNAEVIQKN